MNDLIQQLINPVAYYPQGGRIITSAESEKCHTARLDPRWRNPAIAAKYKQMYDLHLNGKSLRQIARIMNVSKDLPRVAIKEHKKLLAYVDGDAHG